MSRGDFMAISKAQQKAVSKYTKNNYDSTLVRLKKGTKSFIEAAAAENGESINSYIKKAVQTRYEADTGNKIDL